MQKYVTVAALLMIGLAIAILFFTGDQRPEATKEKSKEQSIQEPTFEKRKVVRNVTPQGLLQAPILNDDVLERLPAREPPVVKKKDKPKQWRLPQILQVGVLSSNGTQLSLDGIKPVPVDRVCTDEAGRNWPCGRFGRTAFRNLVRGRTVSCSRQTETETGILATECKIGNTDLSQWLVVTGWAEPKNGMFEEEFERAKSENRGLWRKFAP